jgi:hypothetical protein
LRQDSKYYTDYYNWILSNLLLHYSNATLKTPSGNLVKLRELPYGLAREAGFIKTAIEPTASAFGDNPVKLPATAKLFGVEPSGIGDASTEIPSLQAIPLTYVLYGSDEFTASANILYDKSQLITCL